MAEYTIDKIEYDSNVYKIQDNISGYITGMYIASYGSSTFNEILAAYKANKIVYCRASSSSNPATGNQLRMAFLAYVGNSTSEPTSFEFQYYRSVSSHSYATQGDQVFVYTINSSDQWSVVTREAYTKLVPSTGLSYSYTTGTSASNTIKVNLNSETSLGTIGTTDNLHAVGVDSNGKLCVSVAGGGGTVPTITLNGSSTTTPSFYAPTSVGTDGYVLKSNGSGEPTWTSAVLTDEKLSVAEVTSGITYYPIVGSGTSAATRQIDSAGFSYIGIDGTANNSSNGQAILALGNSSHYTTAGWKQGILRLYTRGAGYYDIQPGNGYSNYNNTLYLPLSTGTLALRDEIVYPSVIRIIGVDDGNGNITYEGTTYDDAMSEITSSLSCNIRCYYTTSILDPEDEYNPIYSGDYSIYYLSYYDENYEDDIVFINTTINNGNLIYSIITIDNNDNITMSTVSGGGSGSVTPVGLSNTTTATLTTAGWSSNTQTVSVSGVTASSIVVVSPAPASYNDYTSAGIYCSGQGSDMLTFTCTSTPSNAITVNVLYT